MNLADVRLFPLVESLHSATFRSMAADVSVRPYLNPFLSVDVFHMSMPTFRPHPHAGFSAVTYLFPESPGAFINRDSSGTHCRIGPGELHWTEAASGVVHEEVPENPGTDCWGVQMFVNLAPEHELQPPRAFHLDANEVPLHRAPGLEVRVLAGQLGQVACPLRGLSTSVRLLDVTLETDGVLDLPRREGERIWAMCLSGSAVLGAGITLGANQLVVAELGHGLWMRGASRLTRLLIGGGPPINAPKYWSGPLALSSPERLRDAELRFRRGQMGSLRPSF